MNRISARILTLIDFYKQEAVAQVKVKPGDRIYPAITLSNGQQYLIGEFDTPAMDFSKHHNMPQILGGHKILPGLERGNMQTYLVLLSETKRRGVISQKEFDRKVISLWNELARRNTALHNLKLAPYEGDDSNKHRAIYERWYAIMGVDDDFNVNDIKFFTQYIMLPQFHFPDREKHVKRKIALTEKFKDAVENITGQMYWRPSLPTLKLVFQAAGGTTDSEKQSKTLKPKQKNKPEPS